MLDAFMVEVSANLVGAFVGVLLAYEVERARDVARERERYDRLVEEYVGARDALRESVARNAAAAQMVFRVIEEGNIPVMRTAFELAVWESVRPEFVRIDTRPTTRLAYARFFEDVARAVELIDAFREAAWEKAILPKSRDVGRARPFEDLAREHLRDVCARLVADAPGLLRD